MSVCWKVPAGTLWICWIWWLHTYDWLLWWNSPSSLLRLKRISPFFCCHSLLEFFFLHLFVPAHTEFIKGSELWINYGRGVIIRYVIYSSLIQQIFVECLLCVRHPGPWDFASNKTKSLPSKLRSSCRERWRQTTKQSALFLPIFPVCSLHRLECKEMCGECTRASPKVWNSDPVLPSLAVILFTRNFYL